jgi:hypothetical protein
MSTDIARAVQRAPPRRVARHHLALAVGDAGGVEQVGDTRADLGEPGIVVRPAQMHDGVVLVGCEQAFAAAAGAEHQQRPGRRRRALALVLHRRLG